MVDARLEQSLGQRHRACASLRPARLSLNHREQISEGHMIHSLLPELHDGGVLSEGEGTQAEHVVSVRAAALEVDERAW